MLKLGVKVRSFQKPFNSEIDHITKGFGPFFCTFFMILDNFKLIFIVVDIFTCLLYNPEIFEGYL
jgi:hypothetical protein